MEVWKPIKGYEGLYEICNDGRVKSVSRLKIGKNMHGETRYVTKEKFLKQGINTSGYWRVWLYKDGVRKEKSIHRLLADAFIPNPENKPEVNHIDAIRHNNSLDNLEWVTHSQNIKHSFDLGISCNKGEKQPMSKLKDCYIPEIRKLRGKMKHADIGALYGVSGSCISSVMSGETWSHIK